jgi:hypothetical protein
LLPNSHWWRLKPPLQRELETRIGRSLVAGSLPDGSTITIALEKGMLAITHANPQRQAGRFFQRDWQVGDLQDVFRACEAGRQP